MVIRLKSSEVPLILVLERKFVFLVTILLTARGTLGLVLGLMLIEK